MKNRVLFIGVFLCSAFLANSFAQTQPENPGFEDWEDVGLPVEEPVNWSSIKTSDNSVVNSQAPIVWGKSNDAHTGNHSIKLMNVETFGGIIATGTASNGRFHAEFDPEAGFVFTDINDARWNTPCTDRPDSIFVWVKYFPQQNDVGKIRALLHTGYGRTPDSTETNWIGLAEIDIVGQMNDWTRLSGHFNYFNNNTPEYILINMYAGNGTTPVKDSYALIDDIGLIYNQGGIEENNTETLDIYYLDNNLVVIWQNEGSAKKAELQILDTSGRILRKESIAPNQKNTIQLNFQGGIYICSLKSEQGAITRKIIIK